MASTNEDATPHQGLTLKGTEFFISSDPATATDELLSSDAVSGWLKFNLGELCKRDALDACRDAEILAAVAQARLAGPFAQQLSH